MSDRHFKLLATKQYRLYWHKVGLLWESKRSLSVTSEFRELIFKMLLPDPNKRPSINQVKTQKWMKQSYDEIEAKKSII